LAPPHTSITRIHPYSQSPCAGRRKNKTPERIEDGSAGEGVQANRPDGSGGRRLGQEVPGPNSDVVEPRPDRILPGRAATGLGENVGQLAACTDPGDGGGSAAAVKLAELLEGGAHLLGNDDPVGVQRVLSGQVVSEYVEGGLQVLINLGDEGMDGGHLHGRTDALQYCVDLRRERRVGDATLAVRPVAQEGEGRVGRQTTPRRRAGEREDGEAGVSCGNTRS